MPSPATLFHTARFWILITLLTPPLALLVIAFGFIDPSGNRSHNVSRLWCRLLCGLNGVRVRVSGLEHVNQNRPQIFIANHQGYFDIFALSGYLPVQMRWVAKASLFKVPFLGWAMKASGYVSVEREDRKNAYKAFMVAIDKVKKGNSVVIFPEGTRSDDGSIGAFKKGSCLLALRSNAPATPVTIIGTWEIIKKGSGWIKPGPVDIIISPAVGIDPSSPDKGDSNLQQIRETITSLFAEHQPTPNFQSSEK